MHNIQKQRGKKGEQLVIQKLISNGFTIHAHNYTKPFGEIDIIAQKEDTLAFIEVKYRRNPLFDMAELISPSKQKKIVRTAQQYCAEKNIIDLVCRFDVALVTEDHESITHIDIIENAFTESSL